MGKKVLISFLWKEVILINWEKAEYANKIRVQLKNGQVFTGCGNGLALASDFEDEDERFDTFFIGTMNGPYGLKIDDIEDIIYLA